MKKKLFFLLATLILMLGLSAAVKASADTYYETANDSVPIWSSYSSSSTKLTTITTKGFVFTVKDYVTNSSGNVWYKIGSGSYGGVSLADRWVYSGNVKQHTHNCTGNGGVCKSSGCNYTYPYSVSSMSALYQGNVSDGAKYWTMPYSTGRSENKGTISYGYVVTVTGKTTNADGNVWYRLSNGYWVYSGNVTAHSHDCTGNGGVCKSSGCGYTYPYSVTSMSALYQGNVSGGAKYWTMPYSTGKSENIGTVSYGYVVTVTGKTTNADGNVWYRLSNGYWVYSENLKAHSHDCTGNGGVCKSSGCGYTYPYSVSSMSAYYQGNVSGGAKYWTMPYSTGKSEEKGTIAYKYVVTVTGKTTNADGNVWYKLSNGYWVYSENLTTHKHDCTSNGGACKFSGCGYTFPLSVSSMSATYVVTNSDGCAVWSLPYSTGSSVKKRTASYGEALSIVGKATNADDHVWYKTSDGYWVWPENLTRRYTVKYDANGGTGAPSTRYKLHGESFTVSSTKPTRAGYIFKYWCTKSDGSGDQYAAGKGTYTKNADATLYAIWEKCTSHDYEGGICTKCKYEYPLTISSMSNTTYAATNSGGTKVWSRPYSNQSTNVRTAAYGTILTINGKTTNQAGNEWYRLTDGNWVYSENITRAYKIEYVLNGGTNNSSNPSYYYSQSISLKAPTRTGYDFAGWYMDSSFTQSVSQALTSSSVASIVQTLGEIVANGKLTIYAKWTAHTYKIAFNGNGSTSGSMSAKSATYDTSVTLTSNAFARTGYTFKGWNTKSDGSGNSYSNGASVKNLTATNGATVTLYAQWTPNSYTVTLNPNGGSVSQTTMAVTYDKAYGTIPTPTRSGYNFAGWWTTQSTGGSQVTASTVYRTTGNSTLYARWTMKPAITTQPKATTVAEGKTATFKVVAAGADNYQWYYKTSSNADWTEVKTNGTSATYSITAETRHNGYTYRCKVTNSYGTVYSDSAKLTVVTKPAISTQPSTVSVVEGKTASFKVTATGGSLSYQWYYQKPGTTTWNAVSNNGKSATYSLTTEARHNGYTYRCKVTNKAGNVTSKAVKLTVKPGITSQPSATAVNEGKTATFKVVATGTGLTYQWYYKKPGATSWTAVSNKGKSATYSLTTEARHNGYTYRCKVTNSGGGSVYSSSAKLTVIVKPTITTQPKAVTVAAGKTATFKVAATGTSLKYQWYYKKSGATSWTAVSNNGKAATYSLTTEARHNGYTYRCKVTNSDGGTVYSNSVKLTVVTKPAISSQPSAVSVVEGKAATFKVTATGGGLSYQWYYQKPGTTTWTAVSANGKSATYSLTTEARHNGYVYRCKVTNKAGNVTSKAVKLTVKPGITTQPKAVTVAEGKKATFKVAATGTGLTYQWYYKTSSDASWTAVSNNGKSATYSLTTAARHNGYIYRCKVTNSGGGSVYSSSAKLTVVTKPAITTQPASKTVTAGNTATFKVTASGTGLSYQWYYKKSGESTWNAVSNNGTSATYSLTTAARHNGYQYKCVITNAAGSVTSNIVKLTVK